MKSKVFKLIIILIVLIFAVYAVYYFISQTDLLVKEKSINLYFSTDDAMYLDSEQKTIKGKNLYIEALNSLIDGPSKAELSKTIPTGVEILDVSRKNDIIQVDFSEELVTNHWGGSTGERMTVYSIVYT
ncbi:MAG: GerMN domain-containing protein, partial [Halanaerobiales bacterium]|nr:GerMN domain-containing protein [Halanaerobiales bacterium]